MNVQDMREGAQRLIMTRRYRAPRSLVWRVWTQPEHVAAWWGPFGPEQTFAKIDLRVGGDYYISMKAPDGSSHPSKGVIKQIIPEEKLLIEGDFGAPDACGAGLPPGALITILFEETEGGTLLTLSAEFPSAHARKAAEQSGYAESWTSTLGALQSYFDLLMEKESAQ